MGSKNLLEKVYNQRRPEKTTLYKLFKNNFQSLKENYEKYENKYGYFRNEIELEFEKYMKCGLPEFGFAKIQCEDKKCGHSMLL